MSQKQPISRERQKHSPAGLKKARAKLLVGIIAILLLVGGLGVVALVHQYTTDPTNNSDAGDAQRPLNGATFSITVSGGISGQLAVSTVGVCGAGQTITGYEIDASGSINTNPYQLLIIIPRYQQPGTYNTSGNGATASISLTKIDNASQTWVSQGNEGNTLVNHDGKSGSLSATLVNAATNEQAQIRGTWACA